MLATLYQIKAFCWRNDNKYKRFKDFVKSNPENENLKAFAETLTYPQHEIFKSYFFDNKNTNQIAKERDVETTTIIRTLDTICCKYALAYANF